jgi:hypothetical protein
MENHQVNIEKQDMNMEKQDMNIEKQDMNMEKQGNENIPLTLIITKPNTNSYLHLNFVCTSLDDCYNKLVINIKKEIILNIDYPDDLDEFTNIYWYANNVMNNPIFEYTIFYKNQWSKPWPQQDIYDSVMQLIHDIDLQNSILNKRNYENYDSDEDSGNEES